MKSIRLRILIYFLSFITIIGIIFIIGINAIDSYYYRSKVERMTEVIQDINRIYEVSGSEDEALMNIEYLGFMFEGKIGIYDYDSNMVIFDNAHFRYAKGAIISEFTYEDHKAYVYETAYPIEGSRWLIYADQLDNDRVAVIQVNVVAMDKAIGVFQSFFSWVLVIGFGLALFLAIFLSRSLTRPIHQLQKVAENIEQLRFDELYEGHRQDEIGQLAICLNRISKTLQKTIADLQVELEKQYNIDKMRRRFIAQVSHELQTPISVISSYTEALIDGIVDEGEIPGYYEILEDETGKMSRMIKDLLELSQLEANTFKFKMEDIELVSFITEMVTRYRPLIEREQKTLTFSHNIQKPVTIFGDSFKLEQGIRNIVKNAQKYSVKFISVSLTEAEDLIILSIKNDGSLIDTNDLPYIFDPFYKGKDKSEGTGLGLSIAKQIFQHHHMEVVARNDGDGVVFDIMIKR